MISKKEVQHIAKLARLGLTETEIKKFQKELSSILDYFRSLEKLDVSKVEPTFHPAERLLRKKLDIMREDKIESQSIELVGKLIEAAPEKKKGHIKVKAVF